MTDVLRNVILPKFDNVKMSGGRFMVRCPAHEDGTASLSISYGDTQPVVLTCHAGCDSNDILDRLDLSWPELSNPLDKATNADRVDTWMPCGHTKVAEYPYRDEHSQLVFAVARCSDKGRGCQGFRQWRPDPNSRSGKKWSRTLPDGTRVGEGLIYRLPEILDSNALLNVYIVEGEKDVDRLWGLGTPATCNPQGAGKWTAAHADWLAGRDIIIVADRDEPGRKHALQVAGTLMDLADSIEIVQAAHGKDVSDHLDGGGTLTSLLSVDEVKPLAWPGVNG